MALRGTATHRKIRRLARRLAIDPCFALGVMEAIWHTTAEQQPDGGIGRLSNEDIADEILYTGDPDVLISSIISERLVDEVDGCRLYIHDWHEWADDAVISKLVARTIRFANGEIPRLTKYSGDYKAKILARYEAENPPSVRNMRTLRNVRVPEPVPEPEPVPVPEPVPDCVAHRAQPQQAAAAIPIRGDDAFEAMYKRHPNKGQRGIAQAYLAEVCSAGESLANIDTVHRQYCEVEWAHVDSRFAKRDIPTLAQWILDKGWRYQPKGRDPPPSALKPSKPAIDWSAIE